MRTVPAYRATKQAVKDADEATETKLTRDNGEDYPNSYLSDPEKNGGSFKGTREHSSNESSWNSQHSRAVPYSYNQQFVADFQ